MASFTHLSNHLDSVVKISVFSNSTEYSGCSRWMWFATSEMVEMGLWCSLNLDFRDLAISPTCATSHSSYLILYTSPTMSSLLTGSFGFINNFCSVLVGLKYVGVPYLPKTRLLQEPLDIWDDYWYFLRSFFIRCYLNFFRSFPLFLSVVIFIFQIPENPIQIPITLQRSSQMIKFFSSLFSFTYNRPCSVDQSLDYPGPLLCSKGRLLWKLRYWSVYVLFLCVLIDPSSLIADCVSRNASLLSTLFFSSSTSTSYTTSPSVVHIISSFTVFK